MEKERGRISSLFIRYAILVLIAIPGMDLFYYLLLPLTKYPIFWALELSYAPVLLQNTIFIGKRAIEIVGACVAGSAYYFLLIMNLSTAQIKFSKRIKLILFTFGTFLIINIIRIYVLSLMYLNGSAFFDITHKVFWYLGSTIFVVLIWFAGVILFKIRGVPFYTDLKYLYNKSNLKKVKKK